jgi:hypothetical protein
LYDLVREIVEMVCKLLTIVEAVMNHPDVPTHRLGNLKSGLVHRYEFSRRVGPPRQVDDEGSVTNGSIQTSLDSCNTISPRFQRPCRRPTQSLFFLPNGHRHDSVDDDLTIQAVRLLGIHLLGQTTASPLRRLMTHSYISR